MGRNPQVCVACTHNCRLFHSTTTTSPTSFFKVIIHPNDFTILYIPPMLNRTLSALVNKKINLGDSSGKRWVVKLSNVDGSLAFEEGWNGFSLSHRLQIGDFLVFNCINKMHFDVKIFDETGCETLHFPKKRSRENQHMGIDLGGTQNSIEIISECVNKKGKTQSMCEDTCFITSCMYQNEANLYYKAPMFEEVCLPIGDTSHASELGMLVTNNSLNETDKIAYNEICTLERGESIEQQNSIILSKMEVEECQFDEGLGSDEVEIHKEKPTLHIDVFHNTNQECNVISDIVDSHVHISSGEVEIHKERSALGIGGFHNTNQEFNAISDILDYHVHIGNDEVEIHKEKHASDIGAFHSIKQEFNVISDNLDSHIHIGSDKVEEIHKEFNPILDILDSQVHIGSDEVEIHSGFNAISDILASHVHIDEMKNVPIDNEESHPAGSDEVEIQKEKHASDIGGFHDTKHKFNFVSDILDSHVHIEEMKNVAIDTTPKLCSFKEKLHASVLGSDEVEIHKEKHASDIGGFHNIKQEPNVISDNLDSHIYIGSPEVLKGEFDHSCLTFDEDKESHFETEATVSCVALTDNNCLKLPECLPLSRSRRKEQRMVVFLKDPLSRLWPVLYHKKPWLNILTHGWLDFQRANDIKPEDVCVFQVENQSERIVAVQIVHN